ncbi:hypothetical protein NL676_021673 [Syzygium grande]|nr:hypothetical protein NL676_021673 [Syzygium grande]
MGLTAILDVGETATARLGARLSVGSSSVIRIGLQRHGDGLRHLDLQVEGVVQMRRQQRGCVLGSRLEAAPSSLQCRT